MRPILVATFLSALGIGCGDRGPLTPLPDRVYITPQFVEAFDEDFCCPQIGEMWHGSPSDWEVDGASRDDEGMWAEVGDSIVLRVQSPLYQTEELPFIVPDTVTSDAEAVGRFSPIVRVVRLVPALLRAEWAADFTGPTVRVELLAPDGLAGVRITGVSVGLRACYYYGPNVSVWIPLCIYHSAVGSPWQPDSSATGLQGWADLTGPWTSWPAELPPVGYGGADSSRAWHGALNLYLEDGSGRMGYGICTGASIPSPSQELQCTTFF